MLFAIHMASICSAWGLLLGQGLKCEGTWDPFSPLICARDSLSADARWLQPSAFANASLSLTGSLLRARFVSHAQ